MGPPAREAVGLSEKLGVDLLVVGSGRPRAARHALSATAWRTALGSAADYIVRSANCPLLVVHGTGVPQQFPVFHARIRRLNQLFTKTLAQA